MTTYLTTGTIGAKAQSTRSGSNFRPTGGGSEPGAINHRSQDNPCWIQTLNGGTSALEDPVSWQNPLSALGPDQLDATYEELRVRVDEVYRTWGQSNQIRSMDWSPMLCDPMQEDPFQWDPIQCDSIQLDSVRSDPIRWHPIQCIQWIKFNSKST